MTLCLLLTILFPVVDPRYNILTIFQKENKSPSPLGAGENWWDTDWSYRKLITINESKVGATLTNFPVLIYRSADTDLAADAQNDGDDICFILFSDNTTQLNHEIESFYGSTGELWCWVNVTSLSGTADTKIWMYYGNSGCSSQQHIADTWDSYYKMVLHLNETTGVYYDSTVNDNDGHDNALESRSNAAKVGKVCPSFDGSANGYIAVWADSSQNFPNDLSVEMYVSFDATTEQCPIAKDVSSLNGWAVEHYPANDMLFQKGEGASPYTQTATNPFASTATWYWAVWTFDDATETTNKFYCNGVQHAATGSHSASHWTDATTQPVYIGLKRPGNSTTYSYKMNGKVDEVRLSNTVRSLNWIYACYNTTNSPTSFHFFGDEEESSGGWVNRAPVLSSPSPSNSSTGVHRYCFTNITVSDADGNATTVCFWNNKTGDWVKAQQNNSVTANTTVRDINASYASDFNTKYWWKVTADDGHANTSAIYHFTTEDEEKVIRPQYRLLTINHSQVNDDLVNFPILVKLTSDANLSYHAQADGDDIRFWSFDNATQYHHEIENYDGDGTLYAWVNITSVSSSEDTKFWMKYGDEEMANQEDVTGTWDSNYSMVQHFSETSGQHQDSTSYDNDSKSLSVTGQGTSGGIVDKCDDFDGADDYVHFENMSAGREEICIEMWINPDAWTETTTLWDEFDKATNPYWEFTLSMDINSNGFMTRHGTYNQSARNNDIDFSQALSTGAWHHVVMYYSVINANKRLYVNGSVDSSTATNTSLPITPDAGRDVRSSRLGWASDTTYLDYNGKVDELRVSTTARNTSWLNATYHTISDGEFLSIDEADEEPELTSPVVTTNVTTDVTNVSAKLWGYLSDDGGEDNTVWFEWDNYNLSSECAGFMATGSVCADGRSLLLKNRWGTEGTTKPRFIQGTNYSFIAIGYADYPSAGWCRMGINEKGLVIANFDGGATALSNGEINSAEDYGEDACMGHILGNYSTVAEAAWFMAQHSSYDAQNAIISSEPGVGAIVAVDPNVALESNITWINNTWAPLVNEYYCDNNNDDNAKQARITYLANRILAGNGLDVDEPTKFSIRDIIPMGKDINASDATHPWWSEPEPGNYADTYSNTGVMATTSVSAMIGVSGNDSYDGALNLVWADFGYSPHTGIMLPLSASYVDATGDLLVNFTSGNGVMDSISDKTDIAYTGGVYDRGIVHSIWNYTRPAENMTVDKYETLMGTIMTCANSSEATERMRSYCNDTALTALLAYEGNSTWYSTNESDATGVSSGEEFSDTITALIPGTVYYYRAWANNTEYTSNGSVLKFMTLPNKPNSSSCDVVGTSYINLSWHKGQGAHYTVIERNTSAAWTRGEGTEIYNGTGNYYNNTGLTLGTTYYYQLWSFTASEDLSQYSSVNESTSETTEGAWQTIQTILGNIINTTKWMTKSTLVGEIQNTTKFQTAQMIVGTILNASKWMTTQTIVGSILNTSIWYTVQTISGSLINMSAPEYIGNYLIITNSTLYSGFANFTGWKTWQGYNVTIVNITDFIDNSSFWVNGYWGDASNDTNTWMDGYANVTNAELFNDTTAITRNYIRYQVYNNSVEYVLMGGDRTFVPVRIVADLEDTYPYESNFMDSYFYCLNGTLNPDEYPEWGFAPSDYSLIDYDHDVILGRINSLSIMDVENYTAKAEIYCNLSSSNLFNVTYLIGSGANNYTSYLLDTGTYFDEGYTDVVTMSSIPVESSDNYAFTDRVTNGTNIVCFHGHATRTELSDIFELGEYDDTRLNNSQYPFILISSGCGIGLVPEGVSSFGRTLINMENGSVAMISNQGASTSFYETNYDFAIYNYTIYKILSGMTLAEALQDTIPGLSPYYDNDSLFLFSNFSRLYQFCYYGDPSISINYDVPEQNPVIYDEYPENNGVNFGRNETLSAYVGDWEGDTLDVYFYTNATGSWGLVGSNLSVNNGTYRHTNHSTYVDKTTYWWSVNVTDGTVWVNETYSYTVTINQAPIFSNFIPLQDATGVSLNQGTIQMDINDPEGDVNTWSIETSPHIGNSSNIIYALGINGTIYCPITGMIAGTVYTVYVNATSDGCLYWNNITYTLTFTNITADLQYQLPVISGVSPVNDSSGVGFNPDLQINIEEPVWYRNANVTFRTNASGSWQDIGYNDTSKIYSYLTLRPDGNSTNPESEYYKLEPATPVGGYLWQVLSDQDDATYVNCSGYSREYVSLSNHTTETGHINNITFYARCKSTGTGYPYITFLIKNAYLYGSSGFTNTDLENNSYIQTTNVYTDLSWTWQAIDDLEVGYFGFTQANFTDVWIVVNYSSNASQSVSQPSADMDSYNTKYWWSVNCTDEYEWNNQTYSFTTKGPIPYGLIGDANVSWYQYDQQEGRQPVVCRLNNSEYYLIAEAGDAGTDFDGFVRTIQIDNDTGVITQSVISSYEYGRYDGYYPSICHIPGTDKYVIASRANASVATNDRVRVVTIQVYDSNGTIKQKIWDEQLLTYDGLYSNMTLVSPADISRTGYVYAIAYQEAATSSTSTGSYDGWMQTIWVNSTGTINDTILSSREFDTSTCYYPRLSMVDSDTIAVCYYGTGSDGYVSTWNISSSGAIGATQSSNWEYDTGNGQYPGFIKVGSNTFAVAYRDTDTYGYVKTFAISDIGTITKSFIDTLTFTGTMIDLYNYIFPINNGSVYGITCQGLNSDGYLYTMNISKTGVIGDSVIDTWHFDNDNQFIAPVIYVNQSYYLIVFQGAGYDGHTATVFIVTNYEEPTFTNPYPVNESVDAYTTPQCEITLNDLNGDAINLYWYENTTGDWVLRQTNTSCANSTYRWTYSQATETTTKYWWKLSANDTLYNSTAWYCFTTESEDVWQTVQTISGSLSNTTSFKTTQTINGTLINTSTAEWQTTQTITGELLNISAWRTTQTITGEITNQSVWSTIQTLSGELVNITSWETTQTLAGELHGTYGSGGGSPIWETTQTITGTIHNSSAFKTIQIITGELQNESAWTTTQTITGEITNISGWRTRQTLSGEIYNTSEFKTIQTIIGSIENISDFRTIQIINGEISNISEFRTTQTLTGAIQNTTNWYTIHAITGEIQNISGFRTLQTINGVILNISSWKTSQIISGYINNISGFKTIQTVYGDIQNSTGWMTTQTLSGEISNESDFRTIQTIIGSISNTSQWSTIQIITGTLENISGFKTTQTLLGSIQNTTAWHTSQTIIGTLHGTYGSGGGLPIWVTTQTINGEALNGTLWTTTQTITGDIINISGFKTTQTLAGSITNVSGFKTVQTIIGEITNASAFRTIQTISGAIENTSVFRTIQTLTGSITNVSGFKTIQTLNGNITNVSQWHTVQTLTGVIHGTYGSGGGSLIWVTTQDINGEIFNGTGWMTTQTLTGELLNISGFKTTQTLNGELVNTTGWTTTQTIQGTIQNISILKWQTSQTIQGTISNDTGWKTIDTITGEIQNILFWVTTQTITGQIFNDTSWHTATTLTGTITNISGFQTIQTITGELLNTSGFKTIQTITGNMTNISSFKTIQTIHGIIQNSTGWTTAQTLNGSIQNTSVIQWYTTQDITGNILNISGWKTTQTINGTIQNIFTFKTIQTITGTIENISGFKTTQTITGEIQNISGFKTIQTLNGIILNTTTFHTVQTIDGYILNISGFITTQTIQGVIRNITYGVQIINIYPANQSQITKTQPDITFTIFNASGATNANYIVFTGNSTVNATHYLFNDSGVGNGTYHANYFNATGYYTAYYWKVCVYDSVWVNETYWFTIIHEGGGISTGGTAIGVIGIFGLIGIVGFFIHRKRKQR